MDNLVGSWCGWLNVIGSNSDNGILNTLIERLSSNIWLWKPWKFKHKTFGEVELRMRLSDLQCIRWLMWPDIWSTTPRTGLATIYEWTRRGMRRWHHTNQSHAVSVRKCPWLYIWWQLWSSHGDREEHTRVLVFKPKSWRVTSSLVVSGHQGLPKRELAE